MAASLQPTSRKTTILDLNDDCLKGVFAYMDPKTLTTAADVCTRFKQNTMHAALLTFKEKRLRIVFDGKTSVYEYAMLRNFGEFTEEIEVDGGDVEKRIIQYLSLYCVGKTIKLDWRKSRMTDEIAIHMRPLLGRVQKLRFGSCRLGEVLLRNLPLWAGLQDSEYGASKPINDQEKQFDHLRQRNLKSISFHDVSGFKNAHIEEFLQKNPQLKEIELIWCDSVDSCVLESIARNLPAIVMVGFVMGWTREPSNRDHIKYLLQLHELKSLTWGTFCDDSYVQSVVHEIASVNTGLDYLDLRDFDLRYNANQYIGGISKLQKLKTLRLSFVRNFTAAHLIEICKHAKELSGIYLDDAIDTMISIDDLLETVENASKLQDFTWYDLYSLWAIRTNIDGNTFLKLAKSVDQRNEKANLCIHLPRRYFALTIPADILTAVTNLKIELR